MKSLNLLAHLANIFKIYTPVYVLKPQKYRLLHHSRGDVYVSQITRYQTAFW